MGAKAQEREKCQITDDHQVCAGARGARIWKERLSGEIATVSQETSTWVCANGGSWNGGRKAVEGIWIGDHVFFFLPARRFFSFQFNPF